jgi:hypothetical protein
MTSTKLITESDLAEALLSLDELHARRYWELTGEPRDIATEAIRRYLKACARMEVNPDVAVIKQCIDDAVGARRILTCGGGAERTNAG